MIRFAACLAVCAALGLLAAHTAGAHYRPVQPTWWRVGAFCLYKHENGGYGWSANTGNGYYGGLQMDRAFQRTYGGDIYRRLGTADRWRIETQLLVAWRGWKDRGWHPWPNTARMCGLL